MSVDRIACIVLNTPDVERLAAFYVGALGFATIAADRDEAMLDLGGTRLVLARVDGSAQRVEAPGWSPWFQHCAIAVAGMERAMDRLRAARHWTPISTDGAETLPPASGGVVAFKFRDPDGHPLELLDLHESAAATGPFLRIDHTAISVVEVARSVAFYESLGWRVGGRSLNRGAEQERLDAVPGAVVDVVALHIPAATGPHLELLAYRGRFDRPAEPLATDAVASTCTVFGGHRHDSGAMRDPDGHRLAFDARPRTAGTLNSAAN